MSGVGGAFGAGCDSFLDLIDTPADYTGQAGESVRVNPGETGLEFFTPGGGGVTDHGALTGLADDDHAQYLLLAGRAGGQTAIGGTAASEELQLRGSTNANLGIIRMQSPVLFDGYTISGEPYAFSYAATETPPGAFVGGGLNMSGVITTAASTFIYESFRGAPTINTAVNPGFAAYTVLQALPVLNAGSGSGHNPLAPLILNAGPRVANSFAGTRTTATIGAVNFAPTVAGGVSGATMNVTSITGLICAPKYSTVAGSTINFGTIRGLHCQIPAAGLFQPGAGVETMTAYYGVDVDNIGAFGGTAEVAALRSAISNATGQFFLLNNGNANSDHGAGHMYFDDNFGTVYGGVGVGNFDSWISWNSASNRHRLFLLNNSTSLYTSNPDAGRILLEIDGGLPHEFTFNCDKFSIGDQSGVVGNQVGVFTAGARVVGVAGGWSDYLLTQAGNLNIGVFAMSDVAAWTINQISLANTAGSITSLDTLVVGGMTTSNPGITVTARSALRVRGRHKQEGSVQYPPIDPSALSAGDNDDWAGLLTGSPNNNGRFWARVSGNATTSVITGIDATAVQDGDSFELTNVGSENILVSNEDTGSTAANRIITGGSGFSTNFVLGADRTVSLRYDSTTSRWRVLTPPGAVAPLTGEWRFDTSTTMADPGSGDFRNNNATLASVTSIAISSTSFKGGDATNILSALASGDQLYIQNASDGAQFLIFDITGVTDNTTWFQIDGTVNASGDAFSSNNTFGITAIFA